MIVSIVPARFLYQIVTELNSSFSNKEKRGIIETGRKTSEVTSPCLDLSEKETQNYTDIRIVFYEERFIMKYISVKEAAQRWHVSERRIHQYCKDGRIAGAVKFGKSWAIPDISQKPEDPRKNRESPEKDETGIQKTVREDTALHRLGAVIVAAGTFHQDGDVSPFLDLGGISLIRRIVLIFQKADVKTIVVVTGYHSWDVEHHLADYGVVFLKNENYETTDKFYSSKLGLRFLEKKCEKIFFASLKIPLFIPETLRQMARCREKIVIPRFEKKSGHPLLLDSRILPEILKYEGAGGMRGAMNALSCRKKYLDVEDEGILLSPSGQACLKENQEAYHSHLIHAYAQISIETGVRFFDRRAKRLLMLIQDYHSVQKACTFMALSRQKAWDMIATMEAELGVTIVDRQRGGSKNRKTKLTREGEIFLELYQKFDDDVSEYAAIKFEEMYAQYQHKIKEK